MSPEELEWQYDIEAYEMRTAIHESLGLYSGFWTDSSDVPEVKTSFYLLLQDECFPAKSWKDW